MQTLIFIAAIVLGSAIAGGTAIYFLRARFRETVESAPSNLASGAAPIAVAEEVKAIGTQIEQAMTEQRMQGETQRQLLAQKLDSVRQSIEAQRNHVDGLRSEMRHESRRRDVEMDEIRTQIGTLQSAAALPPASPLALPASATEASAPSEPTPRPGAEAPTPPEPGPSMFEQISFSDSVPAAPASFEPLSFEPEASEPASFEPTVPAVDAYESFDSATPEEAPEFEEEPIDPFGEISFGDSTAPPASASAPEPWAAPVDPPAATSDVFESWSPALPAQAPPEMPSFVEATFESVDVAPAPPSVDAPVFEESSFTEAPFAAPVVNVLSPEPDAAVTPDGAFADTSFADTSFSDVAPAPVEPPRPTNPEPVAGSFEPMTFAAPPAPSPEPTIDPSWIARPNRPEPPTVANEDVLETASADDFFSLPSAPSVPTSTELSGLVDMDALAAPASTPPAAPAPPAAPSLSIPEMAPAPEHVTEADQVVPAPSVEHAAPQDPEPFVAPEGAEDLTVISSIDADLQRLLYMEGVTTLEEIAQWGRTRARQIAIAVEISEETIMTQWVFEAQAAMFNQFSGQG